MNDVETHKFTHTWEEAVLWLKAQPEKQELVRQCYYDDPVEAAAERFSGSEEWKGVLELIGKHIPGQVLDLGAGMGISSYAFRKAGCDVTALEPDKSELVGTGAIRTLSERTGLTFQIVEEFGETLPFDADTFDIVYCRAVLHHARDLRNLCMEVNRVLKPEGVFLATREHVISKKEDLAQFLSSHALHFLYGGENAYLLDEYTGAISGSGLRLKNILGHYDSVINYAPMSNMEFEAMVAGQLAKRTGRIIGAALARLRPVKKYIGAQLTRACDTPGRHYSFLASKV